MIHSPERAPVELQLHVPSLAAGELIAYQGVLQTQPVLQFGESESVRRREAADEGQEGVNFHLNFKLEVRQLPECLREGAQSGLYLLLSFGV